MELPDLAAATAIAVAISSAGHVKAYRTTPLLTSAEGMAAFGKAGGLSYRGPSS
jgi:hypothetical protein